MEYPPPLPGHMAPPPPQYPPVALAYQLPVAVRRPTGVTVLAIFGISLAGIWLLTGLAGALSLLMLFTFAWRATTFPGYESFRAVMVWNGLGGIVSGLIAAWLLAVSIGCLRMRPWGRRGMVRYAQVDLAWIAIKLAVTLAWAIPAQQHWTDSMFNGTSPATTAPVSPAAPATSTTSPAATSSSSSTTTVTTSNGTTVSTTAVAFSYSAFPANEAAVQIAMALGTAVLSAIFPIIALIYMTRPRIKGAFNQIDNAPGNVPPIPS